MLKAPVVAGPTLFGHVRTHLDELRAGNALPIRFAVADRGRSYAFSLRLDRAEGRMFVVMAASDFLVERVRVPWFPFGRE